MNPARFFGLISAVLGLFACVSANAVVQLPKTFGSDMVIQRGLPVQVWGQAKPGADVQVSFAGQQASSRATADGNWRVSLPPVPVGGRYSLTVTGDGATLTLTNILCGDVWLCSGQSNMQLPVKEVDPAEQTQALVQRDNVRLCSVAKTPSAKPLSSADIRWQMYNAKSARDFSAVACFFAIELLKDAAMKDVPIGLVDSSFGGTTCEGWIPAPALAKFPTNELHDSMFGIKPANLYNGMIAPLGQTAFKGVLWYQGESNSAHPAAYPELLATMIAEWRKQFDEPALPLLIVQLPEYANLWEGFYWPWIREAQARAAQSISNAALVVALGTTDGFNLHPKEKLEIGRRAALAARKIAYGEDIVASGPLFKDARIEGSSMRVRFDSAGQGLGSRTPMLGGFAIAGDDGNYRFADARIEGDDVVVSSEQIKAPKTVRYAWGAMPEGSLINRAGLPAAPFRTDTLPCTNVEVQKQRVARRVATSTYEVAINPNGMATSLVFHGAQFLSNEPGSAGGSSIPGFWGPRTLTAIHEVGPRLLACADEDVTLRMSFDEAAMQWTIANGGKDPITFQLALSPHVNPEGAVNGGRIILSRGNVALKVEGFESITNTPTGALLLSNIKPGATKSITLK